MSPKRGRFITIEGIEGVGKSTQLQYLAQLLETQRIPYILTREPGGTPIGERVRQILLAKDSDLSARSELLLLFAARVQHIEQVILPHLKQGDWVICDRFIDASYAYQGAGRGLDETLIAHLEADFCQGLKPDVTLILDAPVSVGASRVRLRGQAPDRIEMEQEAFFTRVREGYLQRAKADPKRCHVLDASLPLLAVQAQIDELVRHWF